MAQPTITVQQLAAELGITISPDDAVPGPKTLTLRRLLSVATDLVTFIAPEAPAEVLDEAIVRIVGYEYDVDPSQPRRSQDVIGASGAGSILARWRQHSLLGVDAVEGEGRSDPAPRASTVPTGDPYAYYVRPPLVPVNLTTDEDIADSGDGYIARILDAWAAPAGVVADVDFVTEWEGVLELEVDKSCNMEIKLRTIHLLGEDLSKRLVHERLVYEDLTADVRATIALNQFDSRSRVVSGVYRGVEITDADIAAASQITYEIELTAYRRKSISTRQDVKLGRALTRNLGTVSYQLGARGGGAVAPSTPGVGGGVSQAQLDAAVQRAVNSAIPEPSAREAGRVLSVGSQGRTFWDLALDVLLRALPSLSGNKGKILGASNDEAGLDLVDKPVGLTDQQTEELGHVRALASSVAQVHDLVDEVTDKTGLPSSFASQSGGQFRNGYSDSASDEHSINGTYVVHASRVGNHSPAIYIPIGDNPRRWRVVHRRAGSAIATYPNRIGAAPQEWKKFVPGSAATAFYYDAYRLSLVSDGSRVMIPFQEGDQLVPQRGDLTDTVDIGVAHLAAGVLNRLLPAASVANKGKIAAIKADGTGWEVVNAPSGGGGGISGTADFTIKIKRGTAANILVDYNILLSQLNDWFMIQTVQDPTTGWVVVDKASLTIARAAGYDFSTGYWGGVLLPYEVRSRRWAFAAKSDDPAPKLLLGADYPHNNVPSLQWRIKNL